jgi:hypothetical protein
MCTVSFYFQTCGESTYHHWFVGALCIGWLTGGAKCFHRRFGIWSSYKTCTVFATRSYTELAVKIFITAGYSCYCAPSASEPAVKCITADSHINGGESLGGDQTFYISVTFTSYTTLDLSKRILRYLSYPLCFGLRIRCSRLTLVSAYSDTDCARCTDNRNSIDGFFIFLGLNLISWTAQKQPTISQSSTKADYKAMANATAEVMWVQTFRV